MPGDNIPGIPNHKFKFGMDYEVLPGWKVGGDVVYRSSQYYFGAENNTLGGLNPQVSGYATIDLRTSYQVTRDLQIYGLINNVADFRGATFGTLYENRFDNQSAHRWSGRPFCEPRPPGHHDCTAVRSDGRPQVLAECRAAAGSAARGQI